MAEIDSHIIAQEIARKFHGVDGQVIADAIAGQFYNAAHDLQCAIQHIAAEQSRPSVLFRPSIGVDGNKWSILYGENIMEGVVGYGDTAEEAMRDFDKNWYEQKLNRRGL